MLNFFIVWELYEGGEMVKKSLLIEMKRDDKIIYEDKRAKVDFYIISLWLLFLLMIVITIDIPIFISKQSVFIGFKELLKRNIISLISLGFLVYGIVLYIKYKYKFKGTLQLPVKISKIENINFEHLTFLTTYIIPLICIDIRDLRYFLVFVVLLVAIGFIYIKTDLFYANPTLALLGYHIYKVETNSLDCPNAIFISHGKLDENQSVQYLQLDEKVFFVGGNKR